jgi:hypothetical protein
MRVAERVERVAGQRLERHAPDGSRMVTFEPSGS